MEKGNDCQGLSLVERIYFMLAASAIADAMAGPFEGKNTDESRKFLKEGGWIDDFAEYPASYQHHWNVYVRRAKPGTFTDDTRLRLLICEAILSASKRKRKFDRQFLAEYIFAQYRSAVRIYKEQVRNNAIKFLEQPVTLRERFLHMQFLWELAKTATSVFVPSRPYIYSPPAVRISESEYTSEPWFCKPIKSEPVKSNIKNQFNNGSYERGEVMPLGLIALPVLGVLFPGKPQECFRFVKNIDFFDIKEAPFYAATAAAILADLLGGKDWGELVLEIQEYGLDQYLGTELNDELAEIDRKIIRAIMLSHRFRSRETEANRKNFSLFASALYDRFAVGEEMMCTVGEVLPVAMAIVDYSPRDLKILIEFGANYGRDNDTIASLAALFGGAAFGSKTIPERWIEVVLTANGIDFEKIARKLADISERKFEIDRDQKSNLVGEFQ